MAKKLKYVCHTDKGDLPKGTVVESYFNQEVPDPHSEIGEYVCESTIVVDGVEYHSGGTVELE